MRLRRETGDFQIKVTSGAANTIRKGLSAEDFVGELVSVDGVYEAVVNASESEGVVTFKSASYTLAYTKETGALTASEGGAGGSGSGGGSGMVIEGGVYSLDEGLDYYTFKFTDPIATGLTVDDFIGAAIKFMYVTEGTEIPAFCAIDGAKNNAGAEWGGNPEWWPSWYTGEEIKVCVSISVLANGDHIELAYRPSTGELIPIN